LWLLGGLQSGVVNTKRPRRESLCIDEPTTEEKGEPGLTILGDELDEGISFVNGNLFEQEDVIPLIEHNGKTVIL
jgi:hypothetical protein